MMAPVAMTSCPTAETLASFVDNRLDAETRRSVIEHMAECAECRDAVLTADEFRSETTDDAEVIGSGSRFGSRFGYTIAALAAAAAIALLFIQPIHERLFRPSGMEALVAASEGISYRPTDGRLAAGFPYKPPQDRLRGSERADPEASLQGAAAEVLADALEERDGTSRAAGKHARPAAAAYLFMGGGHQSLDEAVKTLEGELLRRTRAADIATALQLARDQPLLVDLSAAYLARGTWTGDEADVRLARAAAGRAWALKQTPEAAWNRAFAAEHLSLNDEAIRAWEEYLALDPSSEWSEEARQRLDELRPE